MVFLSYSAAPEEMVASIASCLQDIEDGITPSALEEARSLLRRFKVVVDEHPETFPEGQILPCIRRLEKAVMQKGVTLEQLDTSRRELHKMVRRRLGYR